MYLWEGVKSKKDKPVQITEHTPMGEGELPFPLFYSSGAMGCRLLQVTPRSPAQ